MKKAIYGKKVGMTQIFAEDGTVIPVTVVEAGPCTVIRKKTEARDGYDALCIGFGATRAKLVNKPTKGQFDKAGVQAARYIRELKVDDCDAYEIGQEIKADVFAQGDKVDVSGLSIGHGFTGVTLRWNQRRGPMTHGSKYHRGVGSMSAGTWPSRVFKNKKMPGQYGRENVTIQNLEVVRVDADRDMLLIKGSIPGKPGSLVYIRESVKA